MPEPRNLVCAAGTGIAAIAAFERSVEIWDLQRVARIAAFRTVMDGGGHRLALSHDGSLLVAAAYNVRELTCYDSASGKVVWQRKDIKRTQSIAISRDGLKLYCALQDLPVCAVELKSGSTLEKSRAIRGRFDSPYEQVHLLEGAELLVHRPDSAPFKIPRETFAILDCSFAPGLVITTESGGSVRAFSVADGAEIWRYRPPECVHALRVGYGVETDCVYAVTWAYQRGGAKTLMGFRSHSGALTIVRDLNLPIATDFSADLGALVCSSGEIVDLSTGETRLRAAWDIGEGAA